MLTFETSFKQYVTDLPTCPRELAHVMAPLQRGLAVSHRAGHRHYRLTQPDRVEVTEVCALPESNGAAVHFYVLDLNQKSVLDYRNRTWKPH